MWQKHVKKTVYTVCVDNYAPEITELTFPFIKRWANKIGADFHVITERKFPHLPPQCEKLQIYRLGQEMENDWNIFIDADAWINPEAPDFTALLSRDTVCHHGRDYAPVRWRYDRYFERDGRGIGSANWFAIASSLCIDLWRPIEDLTLDEILANIHPIPWELRCNVDPLHLIDDYTLSRNIAQYGLKCTTILEEHKRMGIKDDGHTAFFWHHYILPEQQFKECEKMGMSIADGLKQYKVTELRKIAAHYAPIFAPGTFPIATIEKPKADGGVEVKVAQWNTKMGPFLAAEGDKALDSVVEEIGNNVYGDINKDDVVIDAGAYVGVFARYALGRGAKQVISFEPFPLTAACFERNLAQEIKDGQVTLGKFGLWNEETRLEISANPLWATQNSMLLFRGPHSLTVPVSTLDKSLKDEQFKQIDRIDFIKMDIEGAEGMALDGAVETIKKFHPRMAIATEHFIGDANAIRAKIDELFPGMYGFSNGNSILRCKPIPVAAEAPSDNLILFR